MQDIFRTLFVDYPQFTLPLMLGVTGWAIKFLLDRRFDQITRLLTENLIKMSGDIGELKGGKVDKANFAKGDKP